MDDRRRTIVARVLAGLAVALAVAMIINLLFAWHNYQTVGAFYSMPFWPVVIGNIGVFLGPALILLAIAAWLTLKPRLKPRA